MKFSDKLILATRNLSRRMGRTMLTVIGVIVGTCAVVVMISLGIASNKSNEEMLKNWGDLTQIEIYGSGVSATGKDINLDDTAIAELQKLPHVVAVTPYSYAYSMNGNLSAGKNDRYKTSGLYSTIGVYANALEPMGFQLTSGNWLPAGQIGNNDKTIPVLVCEQTGFNFFDSRKSENSPKRFRHFGQTDANGQQVKPFVDATNDTITFNLVSSNDKTKTRSWTLKVVGVLKQDYSKGWWTQSYIVMRIEDLKYIESVYKNLNGDRSKNETRYDSVYVKVDDVESVEAVTKAITDFGFKNLHSMTEERDQMQKQVLQSQLMLGGLAAISLLVAALNIANTMTMAIYERTREIGVMKVLGCDLGSIRTMFLIEAGFIGFGGGVVGAVISLLVGFILNHIGDIAAMLGQSASTGGMSGGGMYEYMSSGEVTTLSIIPLWLLVAAVGFATVIGVLSGLAPANRAVKTSALEAIRHD